MRRTLALTTIAAFTLAACGSSDEAADDAPVTEAPAADDERGESDESDGGGSEPGDSATDTSDTDASAPVDSADTEASETEPAAEKPEVELPEEIPTELKRTVLIEGSGDPAEEGDSVVVDYVGVRSEDGVEFDNSYDRGQPFTVVLGSGSVIQGWEDGLVGAQTGERVQLDIPAEQAYGDQARSDVIQPNTALTFVIDVRNVIEGIDPEDIPTEPGIPLTDVPAEETTFVELTAGDGDALELGDTAQIRYLLFRADNGAILDAGWAQPIEFPYVDGQLFPGLITGMDGMQVGEERAITIIPEDGFGVDGNPPGGLPAETDIIFRVELVAIS